MDRLAASYSGSRFGALYFSLSPSLSPPSYLLIILLLPLSTFFQIGATLSLVCLIALLLFARRHSYGVNNIPHRRVIFSRIVFLYYFLQFLIHFFPSLFITRQSVERVIRAIIFEFNFAQMTK